MEAKDWYSIILGFLLGIPGSIIATWILGSILPIAAGFNAIKLLARVRQRLRRDELFDNPWTQEWQAQTERYPKGYPSELKLYRFMNLLSAEFYDSENPNPTGDYRIVAVIDSNRITGTWKDCRPIGYYGTFQLLLSYKRDEANGKWVGFSNKGMVRTGNWVWKPARTNDAAS
ncbi:hypothetical protein ABID59_001104 [Bradyrhizobium sp. S3.3.6]|uniref:hypothetical protein n=1 Tax=Bradyrhizobium sp. S3.3.6 TaxID=3156429 RepID=UPI0033933A8D